jgi:glucuronosyltransferase
MQSIITSNLFNIIYISRYRERVKYLSDLFKDRPATPLETATFWVEYVLRHRGAPHMHYPGADLNLFQRNSIDVIVFLSLVIYLIFKLIVLSLKCLKCVVLAIFRKIFGKVEDKTKKIN